MKCYGCGITKNTAVMEPYPYPEEDHCSTRPMEPLFVLDCSPEAIGTGHRAVVVCHECFHKLDPDLWISEKCWRSLNPVVPFERLPKPIPRPEKYQAVLYPDIAP
jgi:hypothetical protein